MRDKVIVITGASGGIGAELARIVGARGGKPVLAARRERELNEAARESGPDALAVVADVTDRAQVERLRDAVLARFGHVDAWVNNAGRGITKNTSALTDDDVDAMMRSNVYSALYGMQAILPHFQQRGRGHIVNVSSMLGRVPMAPFRSAYCAAKHALNALTATLRLELRERWPDIHVTTVSPGVVATDFGVNAVGGGPDSRQLPNAQPVEDVAKVIADVLERPRADVYTRPELQRVVADYFSAEDMGALEASWPRPSVPARP